MIFFLLRVEGLGFEALVLSSYRDMSMKLNAITVYIDKIMTDRLRIATKRRWFGSYNHSYSSSSILAHNITRRKPINYTNYWRYRSRNYAIHS